MLLTAGKHTEEKTDTYMIHVEGFFVHFDIVIRNFWFSAMVHIADSGIKFNVRKKIT